MQNELVSLENVVGPDGLFDPSALQSHPEVNDYLRA
jgi:hypothetical protein